MEKGMQDYLKTVAIKTKIENYKEFKKSKEETAEALVKNFQLSLEGATSMVDKLWNSNSFLENASISLNEKYKLLISEKENIIKEYDLKIAIVKDSINGYSIETIANNKGLPIEKVKEILD